MSFVQIKGINDYLLFILNDEVCEKRLLKELKEMISSPSLKNIIFFLEDILILGIEKLHIYYSMI